MFAQPRRVAERLECLPNRQLARLASDLAQRVADAGTVEDDVEPRARPQIVERGTQRDVLVIELDTPCRQAAGALGGAFELREECGGALADLGALTPAGGLERRDRSDTEFLERPGRLLAVGVVRSEEHTSELQSLRHLVCRLLL